MREKATTSVAGAQDRLNGAKKRVASMIARCAILPIGDLIRQIMNSDGYYCNLVNDNEQSKTTKFRAVYFLDDYIFQPKTLQSLNLYDSRCNILGKRTRMQRCLSWDSL
ncbi:hypothetical protein JG688_00018025 [Phytophthora aleatoria]|uniref:Uncharacterized protein n=1 Tax=Phytophthora aleatoria TaxID=2496075 RepID=A0A8J5IRZ6_9STRA|nr:hypothetical protein JG688_00018025 [Phytophthora aleatoria]